MEIRQVRREVCEVKDQVRQLRPRIREVTAGVCEFSEKSPEQYVG